MLLKKSGKMAVLFPLFMLFATNSFATQFGIGISGTSDDQRIYFPINITDSFRTELSLAVSTAELERNDAKQENDLADMGVGLFLTKTVYEKTKLYYGSRFTYMYGKIKYRYTDSNDNASYDQNGYSIAPTIGLEYYITDHISLGGEAEYSYRKLDIDADTGTDVRDRDTKQTITGTTGRVVLRYFF